MKILARSTFQDGRLASYLFWCPGCKGVHPVNVSPANPVDKRPVWAFNGDEARPTFEPSLLVYGDATSVPPRPRCHSFIRDGQIQFLGDCGHALAGQTVPIPLWRGWDNDEEPVT